jgi:hypothetical protein
MDELLIQFGGEVKALGEGRVGGYGVKFSTPADPDLVKDFFNGKTDYATEFPCKTNIYFHHGLDKTVGKKAIGKGELKIDDVGIWVEAQLDLRDKYTQAIYDLAQKGELGWSSGTVPSLVEREAEGKSYWIKSWPLGIDMSLTPTPCEPRAQAVALKSIEPSDYFKGHLGTYVAEDMTLAALDNLHCRAWWNVVIPMIYDRQKSVDEKAQTITEAFGEYVEYATAVIKMLLSGQLELGPDEAVKAIREMWPDSEIKSELSESLVSELPLLPHADLVVSASRKLARRLEDRNQFRASDATKGKRGLSKPTQERVQAAMDSIDGVVSALTTTKSQYANLIERAEPQSDLVPHEVIEALTNPYLR